MSDKMKSYLYLALTIIAAAGPKIAEALGGMNLPQWAHVVAAVVAIAAAVKLALQPSIASGDATKGGTGTGPALGVMLALSFGAFAPTTACKDPNTAHEVEKITADALSLSQVLCVLAQDVAGGVPAIAIACGLDEKYAPAVEELLAKAEQVGVPRRGVGACR